MMRGNRQVKFFVVSYDIPDDRRRARVHKLLSGYGTWIQYSVFECFLSDKELVQLRGKLNKLIRADEDKIRIYTLCQPCLSKVEAIGGSQPEEEKVYVL